MAYYRGKDIEKSRGNAMQEVILEKKKCCKSAEPYTRSGLLFIGNMLIYYC